MRRIQLTGPEQAPLEQLFKTTDDRRLRDRGQAVVMALREGMCDETPFDVLSFLFPIWNRHFVTKMTRKSCLLASEDGKTVGSCR
jgi:hypothetical protein